MKRKLPLKAVIGVKLESHRTKFVEMYGRFSEIVIEEASYEGFIEAFRNSDKDIDLFYVAEDIFYPFFEGKKEEVRDYFRKTIIEINKKFPHSLIHIHIHNDSIGSYPELFELGTVFESHFRNKSTLHDQQIIDRLQRVFHIPLEEFQKKKSKKEIYNKNIDFFQQTNTGHYDKMPNEQIELLSCADERVRTENEQTFIPVQVDEKQQPKENNHENDERPIKKVNVYDDLEQEKKESIKQLIQYAVAAQESHVRRKQSLISTIHHKTIAVVSLYNRAGSSFVVNNLAIALGQFDLPVGVLEGIQPMPKLYTFLGGKEKEPPFWKCWYHEVKSTRKVCKYLDREYILPLIHKDINWFFENVNWIPFIPLSDNKEYALGVAESLTLYYTADELPLLFVDLSHDLDSGFSKLVLEEADEVWIVLEPDLIQLGFMGERLKQISKLAKTNNLFTNINKSHPYIELKNLKHQLQKFEQYLDPEPLSIIPFSVEFLKGGNPFSYLDKTTKEILIKSLLPLIKRMGKEQDGDKYEGKRKENSF
ncbi:hypothetical protein EGH10_17470 [Brevibacillus laterosporus]|uniref:Flp pilus assembly protein, ATPase CpaE n=1 Tax=Brevibacillus laterosporus LMG 15441 TaxID=1042163 RepID=A0A075R0I4_BRELA|nr:hypothetical protein [Brevibacillus laterosporus]AIG26112.1 Flp pilus assembly protein, ATPase CpaE [Brevibacillus laterosporus LMG 15441]RJL06128.1 hypothetical protein DM460_22310 [Brevibacillus laterosporus]TPH07250.1 hypothetical protein EGH10_17470 [Brevibacillus laterosporus]